MPKYRPGRNAVSAVTERLPWVISLVHRCGTLMSFASQYCDMSRGRKDSSSRFSSGWIGPGVFQLNAG
jgi:hypothetical protein